MTATMQTILTATGTKSLRDVSIDRLQTFAPVGGYWIGFSGGKDSIATANLAEEAGVEYELNYKVTTMDPPEVVRFIRKEYPKCKFHYPDETFWQLFQKKKFPPCRYVRYCCGALKEGGGEGRFVATGVRWAESNARSERPAILFDAYGSQSKAAIQRREIFQSTDDENERRRMLEMCQTTGKHIMNPIIEWSDSDVWGYIKSQELEYPCLYDEGFDRIGCIGCPLASSKKRWKEIERYPAYERAYIRNFDRLLDYWQPQGMYMQYKTGEDAFIDWMDTGTMSREAKT